ncbi:hypothetical protein O7635_01920 [Asanoa sp. WMMD1127]|uniref:hypothetical protein n=1 Tax=Asanoa sp. WMMD1127 TaxID=3016107 RepID=UPI0024164C86|nr:hypothetical protein [Asanoa sp. WMMD1127]MDG4820608.1 hypothetical protein [Asanoa sp. WMMD1127]
MLPSVVCAGVGGLDLDAAIVAHLGETYGARAPELWQRLAEPRSDTDRRARRQLWEAVDQRVGELHLPSDPADQYVSC